MKYCNRCSQIILGDIEKCIYPREEVLRVSYQSYIDTLCISLPPHGHLTYSPTEIKFCEAWHTKRRYTPEGKKIVDEKTGKIKDPRYVCFKLEDSDKSMLLEIANLLKRKNRLDSKLKGLNLLLSAVCCYNSGESLIVSEEQMMAYSKKQIVEKKLTEALNEVEGLLKPLKEVITNQVA